MTNLITNHNSTPNKIELTEPAAKGKFQRLCDWTQAHKKELTITLLAIGVFALCFGVGVIAAMFAFSGWFTSSTGLSTFILKCFTFSRPTGMISGLTAKGALLVGAGVSTIVGLGVTGYAAGVLTGSAKEGEK